MKKCGVKIVEGLDDDDILVCELPKDHAEERHASTGPLKVRMASASERLRLMRDALNHWSPSDRAWYLEQIDEALKVLNGKSQP